MQPMRKNKHSRKGPNHSILFDSKMKFIINMIINSISLGSIIKEEQSDYGDGNKKYSI